MIPSSSSIYSSALISLLAPSAGASVDCCEEHLSLIGPGRLAVEAPGGQAEGRVWRRRHGVEKEAVGYLCTSSTEEPTLEASTCTGERAPHWSQ